MKRLSLAVLFVSAVALADVMLKNDNANLGPVTSLNCLKDGGIGCARDAGSVGTLYCQAANAVSTGCITPGAQTLAGVKTFTSQVGLPVYVHASLPGSCSQGQEAYCSTHNTLASCNGSAAWVEFAGSGGGGSITIATVAGRQLFLPIAGALPNYLGGWTLPYAYTVTNVTGVVQAGTGAAATVTARVTDGTNNCDSLVHCDTAAIDAPTGNCTFAASTLVSLTPVTNGCTTPVTFRSDILIAGYK